MNNEALHQVYSLRRLLEETQVELGAKPRTNAATGKPRPLREEDRAAQLTALKRVDIRLMKRVRALLLEDGLGNKEVDAALPAHERKARSLERNKRENFARTSYGAARLFIERGGDILRVVPETASKESLREGHIPLPPPKTLLERVNRVIAATEKRLANLEKLKAEAFKKRK